MPTPTPAAHHPNRPRIPRLLGVWAHPDDEAYLSATLMDRTIAAGGDVTCVTATLGERGFADDDPRPLDERARLRAGELRSALAAVGVSDSRVLGLADGGAGEWPMEALVARMVAVIEEVRPDVVVTFGPDGVTGHPDHVAIGRATTEAWRRIGIGRLLYPAITEDHLARFRSVHRTIGLYGNGFVPVPDVMVVEAIQAGGRELDRKRAALAAHGSQTDSLAAAIGESTYRRWIADERFRLASDRDFATPPVPAVAA